MKTLVNGIEVKTVADLEKAMNWDNQKGDYAIVAKIAENKEDFKRYSLSYRQFQNLYMLNGFIPENDFENVCDYYTFRNWYNENDECVEIREDKEYGQVRIYNRELSIKYNVEKLAKQLEIT